MDVKAGAAHHMTFPHHWGGRVRGDFNALVFKNGVLHPNIDILVRESPTGYFTFSFVNDGTHDSTWTLVVSDVDLPDFYFVETWHVEKNIAEQNIKFLRSQSQSGAGVIGSNTDQEVK